MNFFYFSISIILLFHFFVHYFLFNQKSIEIKEKKKRLRNSVTQRLRNEAAGPFGPHSRVPLDVLHYKRGMYRERGRMREDQQGFNVRRKKSMSSGCSTLPFCQSPDLEMRIVTSPTYSMPDEFFAIVVCDDLD